MKYIKFCENIKEIENLISFLRQKGLDGVEVFNNRQTLSDEKKLLNFTKMQGMLISGGSDYHNNMAQMKRKN